MMDSEDIQILPLYAAVRRTGIVAASTLIAIACLVMAGWQLRIPILRGQVFGSFVSPNAALCFLLCGCSLLLQISRDGSSPARWRVRAGMGLGAAVGLFALLTLAEHITGIDLNIDRLFFAHRLSDWWLPNPGRFAITSAIAFLVGGLGLVFIRHQGKTFISDFAACAVLGVAYIGILGYMFGFRLFYGRVMSMPTAILFAVLAVGMLCCCSMGWVIRSLANPRLGGLLVRRLTAAILFAVPALGLLETWMEEKKPVTAEGGMALLILAVVILFTTLVLRTAAVMNLIDENRDTAQQRATSLSEELSALIEASPVGIIRFRQDRTIASWSAAAERMLGWKAEEIIGHPLPVAPNSTHDWSELVGKLAGGASLVHVETRQVRKDGSIMEALVSGAPIRNASGQDREFIGVIADSTELKLAKEALIRTEKLSAAGRLAASIAHEINNPLEAVTNLLYLARSSRDQTQEFLAMADEELARVTHLTKQTLGFYRDDGAPAAVNISALVESVLNIYQSKLKGKQIRVVKELRAETELSTVAGEVRQVLSNLVANAIDAAPTQGVITIRTKPVCANGTGVPGIQVTVADNGSGIDAALKSKIWEPFFTTKKDVGTGLGLWVSKQIIEKHGGSIRFRSSNHGTLFVVFLPSMSAAQSTRVSA
jgi:PAS domain S-box-containing protein